MVEISQVSSEIWTGAMLRPSSDFDAGSYKTLLYYPMYKIEYAQRSSTTLSPGMFACNEIATFNVG